MYLPEALIVLLEVASDGTADVIRYEAALERKGITGALADLAHEQAMADDLIEYRKDQLKPVLCGTAVGTVLRLTSAGEEYLRSHYRAGPEASPVANANRESTVELVGAVSATRDPTPGKPRKTTATTETRTGVSSEQAASEMFSLMTERHDFDCHTSKLIGRVDAMQAKEVAKELNVRADTISKAWSETPFDNYKHYVRATKNGTLESLFCQWQSKLFGQSILGRGDVVSIDSVDSTRFSTCDELNLDVRAEDRDALDPLYGAEELPDEI